MAFLSAGIYSAQVLVRAVLIQKQHHPMAVLVSLLQDTPAGLLLKFLDNRVKLVYSVHSDAITLTALGKEKHSRFFTNLYIRFLKQVEGAALKRSDLVIFVSNGLRDIVQSHYPNLQLNNSKTINHSIPPEWEKKPSRTKEELGLDSTKLIGYLGKLTTSKGVYDLLNAYKMVRRELEDVSLVFIGDGIEEDHMKKQVADEGIRDVFFLGWQDDIPPLVSGLDVLVLPSHSEGFGRALLAGLACGVPTIGSKVGGIVDVLSYQELMFPPSNPSQLASKLLQILTDEVCRSRMETMCSERAQLFKYPSSKKVVQAISEIVADRSDC